MFVFGLSGGGGSYVVRLNDLYMYDSNDLGVVIMPGLAMTLLLLGIARGKKRWFLLVVLLSIGATIARSGSRGGFLGFVAAGLAALVLANGVSVGRRVAALAAICVALVLGAPPGYWLQMRTIVKHEQDYNYSAVDGRKALIQRGLGYVQQYPLFGLGIDNFARAECTISPKIASLRINGPMRCTPPHNSYLQAGAELGVPGFLVWVSLVIGGIIAPLRLRRRLPKSWRRGTESERFIYGATSFFAVAMVGFAVTSFFVSFAYMDPLYLMAALLTGLYVAARVQRQEGGRSRDGTALETVSPSPSMGWRVRRGLWRNREIGQSQPMTK
jgi:O-antigen ligase